MNIQSFLSDKFSQAMQLAGTKSPIEPLIKQSSKKQFGDYQVNGIMSAAKKLGINPRQFAEQVLSNIDLGNMIEKMDIAGPGFINLFLNKNWLANQATSAFKSQTLNLTLADKPQTIVVDYSAPNIAKEMHVGHLRSTIIGDATVRTLSFLGHHVIRANHVGDWGTQFGMLIAYLEKMNNEHGDFALADLEGFYRAAKQHYDEDPVFAEKAREYVVKLQGGDEYCKTLWKKLIDITMSQNNAIYQRLNVTLSDNDIMGESLYNPMLADIVNDLIQQGIATEDDGAIVVYLDEFKNKDGEKMGVIIRKRDGGFLYTTTDIAAVKYRYQTLHADRILYYIDSRQHQHLQQVWLIAKKAGYIPDSLKLEHHMFGMMLGKDGKPFKTRSGDTVKLSMLLDEAVKRTKELILNRDHTHLSEQERDEIINTIAIGAVKYADLSKNRTTDYVFDWDNMLALDGNTAPYLLYAYTRVVSIFRKVNIDPKTLQGNISITNENEHALVTRLLQFDEAITTVAREGTPHILCAYLYDIANLFSSFYENSPILNADNENTKLSRLMIADLTARTLKTGLTMLGINTVEKM